MADESFMLLSLKEQQSKKLAQVIGSDTCRKILDYLTEKEFATETEAAKELDMPLSTAHYNFKALLASGLVVADEYHYSDKGKEVPHYKLAKKFIIIAPKDEKNVLDKIKKFWPVTALVVGVAAIIEFGQRFFSVSGASLAKSNAFLAADMAPRVAEKAVMDTAVAGAQVVAGAAPMVMQKAAENVSAAVNTTLNTAAQDVIPVVAQEVSRTFPSFLSAWFLGGALFVILVMVVWEVVKKD